MIEILFGCSDYEACHEIADEIQKWLNAKENVASRAREGVRRRKPRKQPTWLAAATFGEENCGREEGNETKNEMSPELNSLVTKVNRVNRKFPIWKIGPIGQARQAVRNGQQN